MLFGFCFFCSLMKNCKLKLCHLIHIDTVRAWGAHSRRCTPTSFKQDALHEMPLRRRVERKDVVNRDIQRRNIKRKSFRWTTQMKLSPYDPHDEQKVAALRVPEAPHRWPPAFGPLLGKDLPPDHQLADTLLGRQWQQAVVLAVQTHVQQVLFRKVVGNQVRLQGKQEPQWLWWITS